MVLGVVAQLLEGAEGVNPSALFFGITVIFGSITVDFGRILDDDSDYNVYTATVCRKPL